MSSDSEETPKSYISNFHFLPERMIPMTGRVARMHNVTYIPLTNDEHMKHIHSTTGTRYNEFRLDRDTPLYTSQEHLGTQGIRFYMKHPDQVTRYAGNDKPEIYPDEDGALWIKEGHHRIIASRLRGEPYIDVLKHESYWE
jgi:hypothetical protein